MRFYKLLPAAETKKLKKNEKFERKISKKILKALINFNEATMNQKAKVPFFD